MITGWHTGGMDVHLDAAAAAVRAAGFDGIQVAGPVLARIADRDAWAEVPGILAAHGLAPVCVNAGAPDLGSWLAAAGGGEDEAIGRFRAALARAARAGLPRAMVCIWGRTGVEAALLARAGASFARFAAGVHAELGLAISVHQHAGCPLQTRDEVAAFAERFDGIASTLTADTAHLALCGVDPAAFIGEFAPLIDIVHLKDLRDGRFRWLGEGTIDFAACFAALARARYARCLVADVYEAACPADALPAACRWIAARWPAAAAGA